MYMLILLHTFGILGLYIFILQQFNEEDSDGNIYEFSVGENEKHVTIPYDGMERTYWVDSYNLPDHPRYGDDWFSPSGEGANVFEMSIVGDTGEVEYIRDKGSYCVNTYADSTSTLWNFRHVWLFVDIV